MKTWLTGTQLNFLANFVGNVAQAVIWMVYLPIFADLLGMESYGLIGFYMSLHAVCGLLVLGVHAAISRELAYLSGHPESGKAIWRLLPRLEAMSWMGVL